MVVIEKLTTEKYKYMALIDIFRKGTLEGKKVTSKLLDKYKYQVTNSIQAYKNALNMAKNHNRKNLYAIYEDILRDNHLSGVIELRKAKVLGTNFNIFNPDGTLYKDNKKFQSKWFYSFLEKALDELYYGFSLIQLDGIYKSNISSITQIPFIYVDIENSSVFTDLISNKKISYATNEYSKWLIEVCDDPTSLGILADIVPLVIWKRTAMAAWAEYTEIFGMPIRIGRTSSNIETDRQRLASFLKGLGKSAWAVIDESEEIEFVETSHTDAYGVYKEYIQLINDEISKRILGGTQITDSTSGSGYAQSIVHDTQFNSKVKNDITKLTFLIQDVLFPTLVNLNIISEGLTFKFDIFETISLNDRIKIDAELNKIKTLDNNYLENTYRVKFKE